MLPNGHPGAENSVLLHLETLVWNQLNIVNQVMQGFFSRQNLLMRVLPGLMILMIILGGIGYFYPADDATTGVYYCPPCGCSSDHKEYHEPGECESCAMPLIKERAGWIGDVAEVIAPFMRGSSEQSAVYSRIIYPTLFGAIFLGFLSVLFFRRRSIELFLALFILCLSLFGLKYQFYGSSYSLFSYQNMILLPISFLTLMGPFMYFHSKSLLDERFHFRKQDRLHFIPGIAFFFAYLILFVVPMESKEWLFSSDFDTWIGDIEQIFGILSMIIYMTVVSNTMLNRNEGIQDRKKNELAWISKLFLVTYVFIAIWVLNQFSNAVFFEMRGATQTFFTLWAGLCMYIYWMGVEVFRNEKMLILKYSNGPNGNFTDSRLDTFKGNMERVMNDEKPFTDPNLTLKKLADHIGLKPKELSGLINTAYHKNFYTFVNEYRLEEVKKLLLDSSYDHLTIVAIAEQAGFNSKSTFNTLFKKEVGMTPKEFKDTQG